jgi:hypothetical protein
MSRIPDCLDNRLTDGGKFVSPYKPNCRADALDTVVHRTVRLSEVVVTGIMDSHQLPVMTGTLDQWYSIFICSRNHIYNSLQIFIHKVAGVILSLQSKSEMN